MNLRDVSQTISHLPSPSVRALPAPAYSGSSSAGVALGVESMKHHMTDEGWQIMHGLESTGYRVCGYNCPVNSTDVRDIVEKTSPGVVVLQDKREWDCQPNDFRDRFARFSNVEMLRDRPDLFKLTILKDSHQRPEYHRTSAEEIGCHAWIVYYHPRIVKHLAPYVRPEHLVRTYHSLDPLLVPDYTPDNREGCLLSGAVSSVYPLRSLLIRHCGQLPGVTYMKHPGYHRNGCCTPAYLRELTKYKAAICTSSMYGYSLRKIIEATACGCVVITDLPTDEVLPEIDANLIRIPTHALPQDVGKLCKSIYATYNVPHQREMARRAREFYAYQAVGRRLANDIEQLRMNYNAGH